MLFGYLACNDFDCTAKLLLLPAATAVRSKRDPELFLLYMHSQACFFAGQLMPLSRDRVYILDPVEAVPLFIQQGFTYWTLLKVCLPLNNPTVAGLRLC